MLTPRRLNNLREKRRYGIGRLLLLARRDFLTRLSEKMDEQGGESQIYSRGRLLPHIDLEGTRSTELARRLGISKQAVAKVVKELEDDGFLERIADEDDGRAYLIKFTDRGLEYLMRMHDAITKVEREYEREFGVERIRALKETLSRMVYSEAAASPAPRTGLKPSPPRSAAAR